MRNVLNNEKGATTIVVAIAIVWIVALCALVVDVGLVVIEKQNLQYAVDAATLAAAQELPDQIAATAAAEEYAGLNGYSADSITVTYNADATEVEVEAQNPVQFFFAPAFGMDSTNLVRSATAQIGSSGYHAVFDYALFSGSTSKDLILNGENMVVNGKTHTNNYLRLNGKNIALNGIAEAVDGIKINGQNISISEQDPDHFVIDMPDYKDIIKAQAQASGNYYTGTKIFNGPMIDVTGSIYVDGKIIVNGTNFNGVGFLFATGEIIFNGKSLNQSSSDAVAVYSENDKIILNGADIDFDGILYSPKNEIILNGDDIDIKGRVIGKTVIMNGKNITITAGSEETKMLPVESMGGIKLIK